ncbi:hypothetical protein NDU88_004476 [Pleurodeles waltl]|uniref:Uncharacterized protein n=1 Tax=Pleurodeles waltl TaxID=8319 RepID=A0AAV7W8D1_PLEWA|nr:hypothetical protein NDU88_004476 [Pleurodeles waltl]
MYVLPYPETRRVYPVPFMRGSFFRRGPFLMKKGTFSQDILGEAFDNLQLCLLTTVKDLQLSSDHCHGSAAVSCHGICSCVLSRDLQLCLLTTVTDLQLSSDHCHGSAAVSCHGICSCVLSRDLQLCLLTTVTDLQLCLLTTVTGFASVPSDHCHGICSCVF